MNQDEKSHQPSTEQETVEELKGLVRSHQVCWEVFPEQIPVTEDSPLKIGFNLVLYGAHSREDHPVPGCEKCIHIYRDLKKVANWIIPKVERKSRYEISLYERIIGYSPSRRNRPEVDLNIKILHRSDFDKPVDECEVQCLNEMKAKLLELGTQEKRWKEIFKLF